MNVWWEAAGGAAAVLTVLSVVGRALHVGATFRHLRLFLLDWIGEPARPGREALPSFPERMERMEKRTEKVEKRTELLQHDFATETTSRLVLLAEDLAQIKEAASSNVDALARMDFRLNGVDQRVTEHRRRNEEQIRALRDELVKRLHAIGISEAQAAMMRSALAELGIDLEVPYPASIPDAPGFDQ